MLPRLVVCGWWVGVLLIFVCQAIASFATFCAAQNTATLVATTTLAPVAPTVAPTRPVETATSTGLAVAGVAPGGGLMLAVLGAVMLF